MSGLLSKLFGRAPPVFLELPSREAWYDGIWSAVAAGHYPDWADLEWFACDRLGQLAFLTTAGQGAVPRAVFRSLANYLAARDVFWHLPGRCGHTLHQAGKDKPRPDDWIKLAQRGLFGYDWGKVTGTAHYPSYGLVTSPDRPLRLPDLPETAAEWVRCVTLEAVVFGRDDNLLPERDFGDMV